MNFSCRWQARREHDRSMRAGLIPSRALQERRILEERKILMAAKAREFEGRTTVLTICFYNLFLITICILHT